MRFEFVEADEDSLVLVAWKAPGWSITHEPDGRVVYECDLDEVVASVVEGITAWLEQRPGSLAPRLRDTVAPLYEAIGEEPPARSHRSSRRDGRTAEGGRLWSR